MNINQPCYTAFLSYLETLQRTEPALQGCFVEDTHTIDIEGNVCWWLPVLWVLAKIYQEGYEAGFADGIVTDVTKVVTGTGQGIIEGKESVKSW